MIFFFDYSYCKLLKSPSLWDVSQYQEFSSPADQILKKHVVVNNFVMMYLYFGIAQHTCYSAVYLYAGIGVRIIQ